MNYDIIKYKIRSKGRDVKDVLMAINLNESGYYKMVKNKRMRIDILEDIAKEIGVDIREFFD